MSLVVIAYTGFNMLTTPVVVSVTHFVTTFYVCLLMSGKLTHLVNISDLNMSRNFIWMKDQLD